MPKIFAANQQPCWAPGKCMDKVFSGKILLRPGYEMTNSKCLDTCAIYGEEVRFFDRPKIEEAAM